MVETPEQAVDRLASVPLSQGFQTAALHAYCDADGEPQFWRMRLKHPDGRKWMRPIRRDRGGFAIGEPAPPVQGKSLYRLPELLAADPATHVYVVEGEACADALATLGIVATTSGSADSANAADWTPLAGRSVRVWPDNDAAGGKYAVTVTGLLRALGCRVERVEVEGLNLPDKGDVVDWIEAAPDATAADVLNLASVVEQRAEERSYASEKRSKDIKKSEARVILTRGCDVEPVSVDWIWPGWMAAGKLHLIGGAPGSGKTTIATALAATITSGGQWPDGSPAGVGDVVIWSGEDDNADTLNPRLRVAGADMRRVHVVSGVREAEESYPFDPAQDMEMLRLALRDMPDVRLIVIDPVVSAVSGDSHKNAEVRRGLQPLVDLAAEMRCALLGVTHFSKGTSGRDPVERITGSLAFGALPRLVMVAAKQEADAGHAERRVLMRAKSNIGPDGGGFVYELQQWELDGYPGVMASRVCWGQAVEGSARELLAEAESIDVDRSATDQAAEWLHELLEIGPLATNEVKEQAKAAGVASKALRNAKERLAIKAQKLGYNEGWVWRLPKMPELSEGAHSEKGASSASSGALEGDGAELSIPAGIAQACAGANDLAAEPVIDSQRTASARAKDLGGEKRDLKLHQGVAHDRGVRP
jgi:putative DNA primase/helicase